MVVKEIFSFMRNGKKYYYGAYNNYEDDKIVESEKHKGVFYYKARCGRCGGYGVIKYFMHNCNGICFECGGSGYVLIKINTAVNKATIERRLQKEKNQIDKYYTLSYKDTTLRNTLNEFGEDFYLILDTKKKSTYRCRKQLKKLGCRWNPWFESWYLEGKEVEDFHCIKIHTRDYLTNDNILKYDEIANIASEYLYHLEKGV